MAKSIWTQKERELLTFMYRAGTSVKGIAQSLGRSEKAVYNYVNRNRDELDLGRRKSKPQSSVAMPTQQNKRGWLAWIDSIIDGLKK